MDGEYRGECPFTLSRALMWQRWESLTFVHWQFPADVVQCLLPAGLTVEQYDSAAWVGLVPFTMHVALPHLPAPPWLGRFAETNVRTYVRDRAGRPGVWFFSLDAARLAAVVTARSVYRLPYFWSSMSVDRKGPAIEYRLRRRWPRPGTESVLTVRAGAEMPADPIDARAHFLTARWRLFSQTRHGRRFVEAEHAPWRLHPGELTDVRSEVVSAAGLPVPSGDPLVHYSPGVDVRLGPPRRVRS